MSKRASEFVHPLFKEGGGEEYRKQFICLSVWVYLLSLGFIFMMALWLPEKQVYRSVVFAILAMGFLSAFTLDLIPWQRYHPHWLLTIIGLTVLQISALIAPSGGDDSPFFHLFLFVIILSGSYFTGRGLFTAILLVILGSVGYHLFKPPFHLDPDHFFSAPIYIMAALATNLLFKNLTRQPRRVDALHEASLLLHAESNSATLIQKLLEITRNVTGARYIALRIFDKGGGPGVFYHLGMTEKELSILKEPPRDIGVLGTITVSGKALRIKDITHEPRHIAYAPGHLVMKSFLGVPITSGGHLLGKLYLTDKNEGHPFTGA